MSQNVHMYTDPKLKPDIQVLFLRAQLSIHYFIAGIKKIYRKIVVGPADRNYIMRISWSFTPNFTIDEYQLSTVTYSTSATPYQTLRTIRELAIDGPAFLKAAEVLLNDTFVDDIITGADTGENVLKCQNQLIKLCRLAQFEKLLKPAESTVNVGDYHHQVFPRSVKDKSTNNKCAV